MTQVMVIIERTMTGSRITVVVDIPVYIMLATDGTIEGRAEARLVAVEAACSDMLQDGWEVLTFRTA
jgi:hypothetical protein